MHTETQEHSVRHLSGDVAARPGLLAVWSADVPCCIVLPLEKGAIEIGRDVLATVGIADTRASRRHVRVEKTGDSWAVSDLGSRNGTFVDGRPAQSREGLSSPLVRIGRTLLLAIDDVRPYEASGIVAGTGVVMGPLLRAVHERIAVLARGGSTLLVQGESGTGKERAAEAFHAAAGPSDRPFVAVNCATIQRELAEGVLFGARRGAFTGAVADTIGLVQSANGGTLFLDEIAEIDPSVQAKLLRALETKKVTPIGATTPVTVSFQLCAATHKDLRAEVSAGRFREDLYFRIGRPSVSLPPLRERREEIPWLVHQALHVTSKEGVSSAPVKATPELVEALMLRSWPGNVRELLSETKIASLSARADGRKWVTDADLDDTAGHPLDAPEKPMEAARPSDMGRIYETPRPWESPRVTEPPRSVEGARVHETPRPWESPRVTEPPRSVESPRVTEPPRSYDGPRSSPSPRSVDFVGRGEGPLESPPAGRRRPGDIRRVELDEALRAARWDLAKTASILGISRTSLYGLIEESPHLRTAGDLKPDEIERAYRACAGDVPRMVEQLQVSERGLRRRLRDLGMDVRGASGEIEGSGERGGTPGAA